MLGSAIGCAVLLGTFAYRLYGRTDLGADCMLLGHDQVCSRESESSSAASSQKTTSQSHPSSPRYVSAPVELSSHACCAESPPSCPHPPPTAAGPATGRAPAHGRLDIPPVRTHNFTFLAACYPSVLSSASLHSPPLRPSLVIYTVSSIPGEARDESDRLDVCAAALKSDLTAPQMLEQSPVFLVS